MKKIKVLSLVLAVAMIACLLIPAMSVSAATEYVYYVSATGDNAKDGKSEANAKASLNAVIAAANDIKYVDGDTVKIIVIGTVVDDDTQMHLTENASTKDPGKISEKDFLAVRDDAGKIQLNADKSPKLIPVTVEGKDATAKLTYPGSAKATDSAAKEYYVQDTTFKNITIACTTDNNHLWLSASVGPLTFDNVKFDAENGAKYYASGNAVGGVPLTKMIELYKDPENTSVSEMYLNATVTFKNGDYTGMEFVAAVHNPAATHGLSALQGNSESPSIVIGAGAKMGTVYGTTTVLTAGAPPTLGYKNPLKITVESGAIVDKIIAYKGAGDGSITYNSSVSIEVKEGATVNSIVEKDASVTLAEGCEVKVTKPGASTPETPAPTPTPNPTPSAPATADASEIVLFSFIALASLAGVVVLKKVTFAR